MNPLLYLIKVPAVMSDLQLDQLYSLVTPERREKSKRFVKEVDQYRSLLGEAMLRNVLKSQFDISNVEIGYGSCGKPYLQHVENLHFNISHAGEYVAVAVHDKALGIDIEKPRELSEGLLEMVFTEVERRQLQVDDATEQCAIQLWTLKESYIKAIGLGLQKPLQEFSFTFGDAIIVNDVSDLYASNRYRFYTTHYDNHWLSLCYEGAVFPSAITEHTLVELLEIS